MKFLPFFAAVVLVTSLSAADQPNIMVFLVDDMGVMDTSVPFLTDDDGQPKRYSDFNNQAFDLCQAGQDNCALKIENGVIRMDWTSANGTRSRYDVDLGTLDIAAYTTKTGEAERPVAFQEGAKCVREPLPEGLQVM